MNPNLGTVANELPPLAIGLLRWTCLLTCAWLVHGWLRHLHPRGRVVLWRAVLGLTFVVPIWGAMHGPTLNLRISAPVAASLGLPFRTLAESQPQHAVLAAPTIIPKPSVRGRNSIPPTISRPQAKLSTSLTVSEWLVRIWAVGAVLGSVRLALRHWQLRQLVRFSLPAGPELAAAVAAASAELGVRGGFDTRLSAKIRSAFLCGFWRPRLLLPELWVRELSAVELHLLLRHELAHIRGEDLRWSILWRWVVTLVWFQPLVWFVPRVHNLACEQEADRIAAGPTAPYADYVGLLARLALRVLALSSSETRLTLNAASELIRRLRHLERGERRPWHRRYSLLSGIGVGVLLLLTISWQVSISSLRGHRSPAENQFETVRVTVLTEDGRPVSGALIQPDGLREHHNRASHYNWWPLLHGPATPRTTDAQGQVLITYPKWVIPAENLRTVQVSFSVKHTDFSEVRPTEYPVDGSAPPVRLSRGLPIEVSGYYGPGRERVLELVPNLSSQTDVKWREISEGILAFNQMPPGRKLLQLMGRLPGGEILFSDTISFDALLGQSSRYDLELKPGLRLTGQVDARVPRPVKNGRVLIAVRPAEFPPLEPNQFDGLQKTHGRFNFWKSYRSINADGTFVFEAIPPGELDVVVHGDGFCSSQGRLLPEGSLPPVGFGVPQTFPLNAPTTEITVLTESTASVRLVATTRSGQPLVGAKVYFNPNQLRIGGIFGDMKQSSEEPFRFLPALPPIPFEWITGEDGEVLSENLPAFTPRLDVEHPDFDVPISSSSTDRHVRFEKPLRPGETTVLTVRLQPKGRDLLGSK